MYLLYNLLSYGNRRLCLFLVMCLCMSLLMLAEAVEEQLMLLPVGQGLATSRGWNSEALLAS
jgi:hypothetical protein